MAWEVPRRVREALGDEVVMAFVPWLDERYIAREKAVPRDEYREVLSRLDGVEKDISLIKEELAGFRVELGQIRTESREDRAQLRAEFKHGQAQVRAEFKDGQAQLRAGFKEGQAQMRAEFKEGQAQMRAEVREDLGELRREVHERFDRVNERFDQVYGRFDEMGARFDQMYHQMAVQTRWLIGALALIGTVVSALLAIAQFTP